ncbi:hypothetical protein CDA63_19860 [Hymenobacter amundsenii]|uniref:Uncharacterized protein n=1 Tax=Hymenobacter amundsenii TaxID=2006685 RepID=A0A246FFS5_9BACT|nr:hypothetical protein [Hymenobacter amundsenii]OWP61356.1 hypothetical protein CDA63_19860 [Hymenobacter amundsenii]
MSKDKKKKHNRQEAVSDDLFSATAQSIRKFRQVTDEIAKLSTGQKLAGGLALVVAGVIYLERHRIGQAVDAVTPDRASWPRLLTNNDAPAAAEEVAGEASDAALPAHKSRKPAKSGKGRRPATGASDFAVE